mmetsp:Transcript_7657/g.17674  ORF Transcript_7657/g.17674 Transcript_7657/m.17674 type:complete len:257 (-) Transcript_7657:2010-2780(-)
MRKHQSTLKLFLMPPARPPWPRTHASGLLREPSSRSSALRTVLLPGIKSSTVPTSSWTTRLSATPPGLVVPSETAKKGLWKLKFRSRLKSTLLDLVFPRVSEFSLSRRRILLQAKSARSTLLKHTKRTGLETGRRRICKAGSIPSRVESSSIAPTMAQRPHRSRPAVSRRRLKSSDGTVARIVRLLGPRASFRSSGPTTRMPTTKATATVFAHSRSSVLWLKPLRLPLPRPLPHRPHPLPHPLRLLPSPPLRLVLS